MGQRDREAQKKTNTEGNGTTEDHRENFGKRKNHRTNGKQEERNLPLLAFEEGRQGWSVLRLYVCQENYA
jgi:hypothetical protein